MKINKTIRLFRKYLKQDKGYSHNTIYNYTKDINQLQEYSGVNNIEDIKSATIREWLNNMDIAVTTRNRKMYSIRSLFNFLTRYEYLDNNPAEKIEVTKDTRDYEPVYLTEDEAKQFLKVVENYNDTYNRRNIAIVYTLLFSGLRVSELANLNIDNYSNEYLKFIGKGNKERIVPLHSLIKDKIKRYLPLREELLIGTTSKALFVSKNGNRISTRTVQRLIKKYINASNINKHITPHKLRHTFASMFYKKTKDLKSLQDLLGHSSLSSTTIYTHTDQEKKTEQVNSLTL